jgi:hypothetical protein
MWYHPHLSPYLLQDLQLDSDHPPRPHLQGPQRQWDPVGFPRRNLGRRNLGGLRCALRVPSSSPYDSPASFSRPLAWVAPQPPGEDEVPYDGSL